MTDCTPSFWTVGTTTAAAKKPCMTYFTVMLWRWHWLIAGFEAALSRRLSWGLEAYYQRLFKKTTAVAPDFMGLQAEIFYTF